MNLVIDIGNSTTKIGIFNNSGELVFKDIFSETKANDIIKIINDFREINYAILSTVKEVDYLLKNTITDNLSRLLILDNTCLLPVKNLYKSPETLGKDRIAAAVGANLIYPNRNILIIDAGTALTIDFINENQEFIGGIISPGLEMRFKALNYYTDKLPLFHPKDLEGLAGRTTEEAIILGVQNGMIYEINEYIRRYSNQNNDLKTLITGGDARFFAKQLKNPIFADENIVLKGLNRILEYNVI